MTHRPPTQDRLIDDVVKAAKRLYEAWDALPHANSDDDAWLAEERLIEACQRMAAALPAKTKESP